MADNNFLNSCKSLILAVKAARINNSNLEFSADLNAPVSGEQTERTFTGLTLNWTKVVEATEYLLTVQKQGEATLEKLLLAKDNQMNITGLMPGQVYEIHIHSVTYDDARGHQITLNPLKMTLETDYIIAMDIPPMLAGQPCPFGDCPNPVTITGNCFDWATGTVFYRIEIVQNTTGQVLARNYLKKSLNGEGKLTIAYSTGSSPCQGADIAPILNGATLEGCEGLNTGRICGSFPNGDRSLGYSLVFSPSSCCLDIHGNMFDNEYHLRVNLCQEAPGDVK
jgi:hypothetical protein